jgi:hypothetical protein
MNAYTYASAKKERELVETSRPVTTLTRPVLTNKYSFLIIFISGSPLNASRYNLKIIFKSNTKQHTILKSMRVSQSTVTSMVRAT